MSQGILHIEFRWLTSAAPKQINKLAGRDDLQTQIIRKAMEARQVAQKNEQGRNAMRAPRPWWHPKFGSLSQT